MQSYKLLVLEKVNPITGLDRHWGFQEVEAHGFQDNQQMKVVRLSALRNGLLDSNIVQTSIYFNLLLHGFTQTSRKMLELLVKLGYEIFLSTSFQFDVHRSSCYIALNFIRYFGLSNKKKNNLQQLVSN